MNFSRLLVLCLISGMCTYSANGQDLQFEWSRQVTQIDAPTELTILNIDNKNNVYAGAQYGDSLIMGDTLFIHNESTYYDWPNWAIGRYDENGSFIDALDIYTCPYNVIESVHLVTDRMFNIYLACEFHEVVYVREKAIHHGKFYHPDFTDLLLMKLSPEYQILWAKVISSPMEDICSGLSNGEDGMIYLATQHHTDGYAVDTVNYFNQDTAFIQHGICSVLKIHTEGKLLWRKTFYALQPGIMLQEMNINLKNKLTLTGFLRDHLYYENDTVFHPFPGEYLLRPYVIEINSMGELISGTIPDWRLMFKDTDRDDADNLYFSGTVFDTIIFGSDTITKHPDSTVYILAKTDKSYKLKWWEVLKSNTTEGNFRFTIDSYLDTMFFTAKCRNSFQFFDNQINVGPSYGGLSGIIGPSGDLLNYKLTLSDEEIYHNNVYLDNDHDLIVSGTFRMQGFLGQDTIQSYSSNVNDGFIAKLERTQYEGFKFGEINHNMKTLEESKTRLRIFPNPCSGILSIRSKEVIRKIEVIDTSGKIILSKWEIKNEGNTKLNLSTIERGIYILKIYYSDHSKTEKLLVI